MRSEAVNSCLADDSSRDVDPRSNIQAIILMIILMKFLGTHRGLRISIFLLYIKKKADQLFARTAAENALRRRRYFIFPRSRNAVKVVLAREKKRSIPKQKIALGGSVRRIKIPGG